MNYLWRRAGDSSPGWEVGIRKYISSTSILFSVPSISGPISQVLSLSDERFLILHDGRLSCHESSENTSILLDCVDVVISVHHDAKEGSVLAVTGSGALHIVDIDDDTLSHVSTSPGLTAPVISVAGTDHHQCLVTSKCCVWVRGSPPCVGQVSQCDQWSQVMVSSGRCEVVSLVCGADFTAAVVRRHRDSVSPVVSTPEDTADSGDLCPLGLQLSSGQPSSSSGVMSQVSNIGPSVVSHVTNIGRSVWSGSMSLLSLTSQVSTDSVNTSAAPEPNNDEAASVETMTKSHSEPPADSRAVRVRRLSEGGDSVESVETLVRSGERLCSDTLVCWGVGRRGQLGLGDMLDRSNPCQVTLGECW